MSDYISRKAALAQCKRHYDYTAWSIADGIEAIPAADVAPVRHVPRKVWGIDEYYGEWLRCPNCGYEDNTVNAKYCGGCGSKMDLEGENNDN